MEIFKKFGNIPETNLPIKNPNPKSKFPLRRLEPLLFVLMLFDKLVSADCVRVCETVLSIVFL